MVNWTTYPVIPVRVARYSDSPEAYGDSVHRERRPFEKGTSPLTPNTVEGHRQSFLDVERAGGNETILLVEDDDAVRAVTRRALKRFGYNVLSACGGDEALQLARRHPEEIDLLLTDIMMPGLNGVEVAAKVSRICEGIHVFYMSGYADQDLIRQGLLSPGTRFLQKPFTPQELADRVRDVLDG